MTSKMRWRTVTSRDLDRKKAREIVVSVKGGGLKADDVRALNYVREREERSRSSSPLGGKWRHQSFQASFTTGSLR
jgi:hypothetical protein